MVSGRYRLRDVFRVPGLISLSRVGFAAAFPFAVDQRAAALALLAAAGVSDVLDGWYARRFGQVSATGSALDPITDKIFVTTVAVTLVVQGHLSLAAVVLLSVRELGELPLVLWFALSDRARRARAEKPSANWTGKLATFLQFVAVSLALLGSHLTPAVVGVTALAGAFAAWTYWWRALATKA